MEKYGADFIVNGDVLGQRPMSQNKKAMEIIENHPKSRKSLKLGENPSKMMKSGPRGHLGWSKTIGFYVNQWNNWYFEDAQIMEIH